MITIGESFAHYRITGKLGAGGMGEVFRAQDTKLKREVAIKVLPEAFARDEARMKRFEREAQVLASLNHPNIAAIYGLEDVDGARALVLELVEGPTLAERIASGPLPLEEALSIARQIAVGLEAAHEKSVIHRDLKPPNVKLTKDGDVKILDFGLAKALEGETPTVEDSNSPTLMKPRAATQAGVLLGTAAYMSPEQAKGKPVDRRADVWAFGAVLFEMLTGNQLFSGETASETLASVIKDEPALERLPVETPSHIRWLVRRCLTKDPTERLRDIGEARIAIDRPEMELETSVAASDWVRSKIALAAVAASLVASVITGIAVWRFKPEAARPLARFVATPPGSEPPSWRGNDVNVAITPDGTRIVYAVMSDGRRQLVVRALDGLEAIPLTGAGDNPRAPFLSPDGNWVGYFEGNRVLRKVSIHGGPPVTISEHSSGFPRGASWGDDGTIVFATGSPSGLWRVPEGGGEPEALTQPGPEERHFWPDVLPGGEAVLFSIRRGGIGNTQIAVLSLSTGESKVLIAGGSQPRYVTTGHIVYGVAGALRAVGFDLERLEVTSDPVPVLEGVLTKGTGAAEFGIARDGSLVYIAGSVSLTERTLVWVDRQGQEESLSAPPRAYSEPRLSPDASRVALQVRDQENDIWIWDFARETLTRLTFDPGSDGSPTWTPDGLRVAFSSGSPSNLFWKAADGTGSVERLTESPNAQVPHDVSPDGTRLIFRENRPETGTDLIMLSLEDGRTAAPLLATEFNEQQGEISPDGRFLAYVSDESGRGEVYLRPFPNVEGGHWQVSTDGGGTPLWARNGRELFYRTLAGHIMAVPVQTSPSVALGNAETVVGLGYVRSRNRGYDVSPNGERFLMIKDGSTSEAELILVQNWGEELKRLVPSTGAR